MEKTLAQVAGEVLVPPAKESGKQLATLMELLFTPLQMAKIYRDAWIDDFKRRIFEKFQKVPIEKLQEPPLNIIGPALEASKYHIAIEEMREMFANLVAHACDQDMMTAIHPSFVNILAQISSLEANILSSFRPKKEVKISISATINGRELPAIDEQSGTGLYAFPEQVYPIVNYYLAKGNERLLVQNNVMKTEVLASAEEIAASVTNLIRLGLIETNFQMQVTRQGVYDCFFKNDLYQTLSKDVNPGNQVFARSIRGNMIWGGQYDKIVVEKGIVRLTQFGFNFIKVCVLEKEIINEE